ncbi:MAG: hypothetical protein J5944_06865 [Lentisphaeria bacterium]|nr:hypothetical protein [Lentisphaeria bacterium]
MKKILVLSMAAVAAVSITGCRWCNDVQTGDPSCVDLSHEISPRNHPATVSMVTPNIAISREVFRPVFRAGSARLTVEGSGFDVKDATYDAISRFLAKANCDYIVSVSTVSVRTDHPKPWWDIFCQCRNSDHSSSFFPPRIHIFCRYNTNYKVTLSGIPIYLEKLSTETLDPKKVELYDTATGLYLPARGYDEDPEHVRRKTCTSLKGTDQTVMPAKDKGPFFGSLVVPTPAAETVILDQNGNVVGAGSAPNAAAAQPAPAAQPESEGGLSSFLK